MRPSSTEVGSEAGEDDGASQVPSPPRAPEMRRRLLLTPLQMWGMPLIALLPVLALLGVVGMAHDQVSAEGDGLRLEVRYPRRSHSGVTVPLTITVSNQGQAPLEDVYLVLPRDYLESFEEFELRPSADSVSLDAYRIVLGSLPAGASRVATALLTPGEYGSTAGRVEVGGAAGPPGLGADFTTFSLP